MIHVQSLRKSFGRVLAVSDVSFSLPKGIVAGLLGPNGAGKTTTIRMITGFLTPDQGTVTIADQNMNADAINARKNIGYLPESAPIYPEMTPREYLAHRARLFGIPRNKRNSAIDHALERCWLNEMQSRPIGHLSKGYRQRVGLASAIVHNPPVIVLDEPTNGLDPSQILETRKLMHELGQTHTLLISSHILSEIQLTCQRIIIIARGKVRADAPTDELTQAQSASPSCTVEILPTSTTPDPAAILRAIPGVKKITRFSSTDASYTTDTWHKLKVDVDPDHSNTGDLRESIARAAFKSGLLIRELHAENVSLERMFLELIEAEDSPQEIQ